MLKFSKIVWFMLIYIRLTQSREIQLSKIDSVQAYCTSFDSCWECKRAGNQCDWCHEVGCTHYPSLSCPQKLFFDKVYHKTSLLRYCTEIIPNDPIFVPANLETFIKLNLRVDDFTLYNRNIMCEIHIDQSVLNIKGAFSESTVYCDMIKLEISRSVSVGYVRLLWGGAEPYSNMALLVVYNCSAMARNCLECRALDKRFNCGWCEEISQCNFLEQCPGQYGQWINSERSCGTSFLNKRNNMRDHKV